MIIGIDDQGPRKQNYSESMGPILFNLVILLGQS